jgi:hypothetical protein
MVVSSPRHRPPGWLDRDVREGLATQRRPPCIPSDPQDIMAALLRTPPPPTDENAQAREKTEGSLVMRGDGG